jgi:predicted TIM-barrel fold metal-dependent hydrolase
MKPYPWMRNGALMAYHFPNVYVDMSWEFPWLVLGIKHHVHDFLSIAPLSKITYGGGCHTGPETAFLGAIVLKRVLARALSELVEDQFLTVRQAEEAARQILHRNVAALYGLQWK